MIENASLRMHRELGVVAYAQPDSWLESYHRLWEYNGGFNGGPVTTITFDSPSKPSNRQMLRRYFALNAVVIAACVAKPDLCTILDLTRGNSGTALERCVIDLLSAVLLCDGVG
jgi:hypothetical protein